MADAFWIVVFLAVCIGMLVLATRIEPHSVSKDGSRFTCRVQHLATDGRSGGRWMEAKADLVDDRVHLNRKSLLRPGREVAPPARVLGRSQGAPTRFAVFLLEAQGSMLALRVPKGSRAVARLDELAA